ncbi:MAG: class I SAM-dependent methyltransferase [Anaerolineae bacterium]|nr:class I SAM-dependent methyltransferase [Anaerolineae bacterium]
MSETTVFGPSYAALYDHFYAEKDYAAECDFLEDVFRRYASRPVRTVLDLGCGTGGHALLLAQRGYQVTGVDRSQTMLASACAKSKGSNLPNSPKFVQNDIRSLELGQTFDVVTAMFAVMGYMTTNEDLAAALHSARRHLSSGGLLIFDAWYGPAVLTQRPADRYRITSNGSRRIIRFVRAELDSLHHVVNVNYKLLEIEPGLPVREVDEVHVMRYLFAQEIVYHLSQAGFHTVSLGPCWQVGVALQEDQWNMAVVARAIDMQPFSSPAGKVRP